MHDSPIPAGLGSFGESDSVAATRRGPQGLRSPVRYPNCPALFEDPQLFSDPAPPKWLVHSAIPTQAPRTIAGLPLSPHAWDPYAFTLSTFVGRVSFWR